MLGNWRQVIVRAEASYCGALCVVLLYAGGSVRRGGRAEQRVRVASGEALQEEPPGLSL